MGRRIDREHEGRLGDVAAALLIGGASSRMGRDKASLEFAGEPMAVRIAKLLDGLFEEVLLVGGEAPAGAPGRRVPDVGGADEPRSALRGIVSALEAADAERVLVVATDLPLLSAELVLALPAWPEHDAVVPRDRHGIHPLCAIYRRDPVLTAARKQMARGRYKLTGVLEAVDTDYVTDDVLSLIDPRGRALTNVNTPDDAEEAAREFGS